MEPPTVGGGHNPRNYLIGFVLAFVADGTLVRGAMFAVIAVAAVLQVLVHLRFFLNLRLSETPREDILALVFAAVLVFIMIGETLWIIFNLDFRRDI